MDYRLECLIDAALATQSPMMTDTKFKVSDFPIQVSPDTKNVIALTQQDKRSSLKRSQIRSMKQVQKKQKKETMLATKTMYTFLCDEYIDNYTNQYLNSETAHGPNVKNNTKIASNAWKWKHEFNWG
eukprot:9247548-Ditylum_brightwellii.AAC.1